jgi:hypothetical protein
LADSEKVLLRGSSFTDVSSTMAATKKAGIALSCLKLRFARLAVMLSHMATQGPKELLQGHEEEQNVIICW